MKLEELKQLFKDIDKNKYELLIPLMEETIFLKTQLDELKKYPIIKINPNNPSIQKRTEAGKMIKDYQQAFNVNIKILLSSLDKNEESDKGNEILKAFADKVNKLV